jgi:hemolysin-activating ACP:hemolysin acyltransferase
MDIRNLKPGFATLGVLTDFLARDLPFANLRAGELLAAITYQLSLGQHVAGFENNRLVAYCGWITTTTAQGEEWLQGKGRLSIVPVESGDAVALTIVKAMKEGQVLPMIRACRDRNKGKRVFFKRDYALGDKLSRRSAVVNRDSSAPTK